MPPADAAAIARLSPRQREVLRFTFDRKTSKEIASALGLSESTVNGYIAEAVALLGARNRRHAAELLQAHEAARTPPHFLPPQSMRGETPPSSHAPLVARDRPIDWRSFLPIRRKGSAHNDLSILLRLAWIFGLALLFAIGFGMLVTGLDVLSRLFAGHAGR